jgi:hypothetical protein
MLLECSKAFSGFQIKPVHGMAKKVPARNQAIIQQRSLVNAFIFLLPLNVFLHDTVAFILAMGTPMGEINATFVFSVTPCLKRSGW